MTDNKRWEGFDRMVDAYENVLMEVPDAELGDPTELLARAANTRLVVQRAVQAALESRAPRPAPRRRNMRWPAGTSAAPTQAVGQRREGLRASFSSKSLATEDEDDGELD